MNWGASYYTGFDDIDNFFDLFMQLHNDNNDDIVGQPSFDNEKDETFNTVTYKGNIIMDAEFRELKVTANE